MQSGSVTTPVGRRPMTLALVKRQLETAEIKAGKTADKWRIFRDACAARATLGVQDRALAVLDALLTFYPHAELSEQRGLVVFPSNAQLSIRAHGITGTTLRRHLAALVDAGLIVRKDSPNGKRYAHKGSAGDIEQAFGFSLAPMLARAEELAQMAQEVAAERRRFLLTKEALSICRRDVRKLISAAVEEGAAGDWAAIENHFLSVVAQIPRSPTRADLEHVLTEMEMLRDEIVSVLETQMKSEKTDANDVGFERHIQNSNTDSSNELEPCSEQEQGAKTSQAGRPSREPIKAFPLGMVLQACPNIVDYGPGGAVTGWRDLMSAAVVVRSTLGVSPSAYQDACEVMGPENAAVAMACILERAGHINSAGGYLRDLTAKARQGEFSLGPMLMALMRLNGGVGRKTAS
ncbi:plasmid replication protein RepC [Rhizobium leguminosarum]|uniref:plasmid replication protein RepC n=1 Tax=Rhizobium leguminosarum TaxID=384 RepID=UPI00037056FC|nr:plasmid replication protein RepC [Rhizobium leguminosarum]MBY5370069.1 replication initiation protein RepC [Rhizobium leguminosarum]MBY5453077.1 replication initiation protein RepC [Rhizobium leguminosarum]